MTEIRDIIARAICEAGDYGRPELLEATEHRGDCTEEAFTCAVCLGDETREMRDAVLKALHDAGYWVAPREPSPALVTAVEAKHGLLEGFAFEEAWVTARDAWEKESG